MELPETPFTLFDWNGVTPHEYPGQTGTSMSRSFTSGDLRVRVVDYGAGYLADHWCDIGHVLLVSTAHWTWNSPTDA
ncbi:DHCW motif cupin fold protein [Sedimentitalea sp. XS_ASV28]|uniref:DHCW motif cupin fold protein n=1 Tax=Sedimentitalea sp. XS_ASV28 TaxID=3241296 RepID=UPI0035149F7A